MKLLNVFLAMILLTASLAFAMQKQIDEYGNKIGHEYGNAQQSAPAANQTLTAANMHLAEPTELQTQPKKCLPAPATLIAHKQSQNVKEAQRRIGGLVNLIPTIAQFPTAVWMNVILPYAMSETPKIIFDLPLLESEKKNTRYSCGKKLSNDETKVLDRYGWIIETKTAKKLGVVDGQMKSKDVCWSPDDSMIALNDFALGYKCIDIVDGSTGQKKISLDNACGRILAWSNDSTKIASLINTNDDNNIDAQLLKCAAIWDIKNPNEPIIRLPIEETINSIIWSKNDQQVIVGYDYNTIIKIWDINSKTTIHTLKLTDTIRKWSMSPKGTYLAVTCADKSLFIWNIITGQLTHVYQNSKLNGSSTHFSWSPDEKYIIMTCQYTGYVHIFDLQLKTEIAHTSFLARNDEKPIWNKDNSSIIVSDGRLRNTYNLKPITAFYDRNFSQNQTILLWLLEEFRSQHPNQPVTLAALISNHQEIDLADAISALHSFAPTIRMEIIRHYKIIDALHVPNRANATGSIQN